MTKPMKVLARDAEDIQIISACLQDSLVPLKDMAFFADEKRFVLAVNRFRWEQMPVRERTLCGIRIEGVSAVRYRDLDRTDQERMQSILSLQLADRELFVHFAGGGALCLTFEPGWTCLVDDMGRPWSTKSCPSHGEEEP
ncbi:MAG: DUF2948 family protein [Pseudomonadota bacterium]|nr:DUF2948 family protein [Pseudomonadota bacterium]